MVSFWCVCLYEYGDRSLSDVVYCTDKWFRQLFDQLRISRSKDTWVFEVACAGRAALAQLLVGSSAVAVDRDEYRLAAASEVILKESDALKKLVQELAAKRAAEEAAAAAK